ncbi:MAG: PepSY-like domain-containing protein [Planctomycetes bacterium]|nr:PepSY-like domain-containing protein [Planctomycetota bacterium]
MNKRVLTASVVGFAILGAAGLAAWAQEESLTIDKVPAAVKAAILKETAGGKIKEIEAETKNGKTIYEVEFVRDGKTIEIAVAADGALLPHGEEDAERAKADEQEREVKEAEVPPPALAALKKLAGEAKIAEFAEEIEHGGKFYEGSWKVAGGTGMDALVTATGALVELEEEVKAEQVPAAVFAAVKKAAGPDAKLFCEKKTMILYEVKFSKGEERHELLYTPDGRVVEKNIEKGKSEKGE